MARAEATTLQVRADATACRRAQRIEFGFDEPNRRTNAAFCAAWSL